MKALKFIVEFLWYCKEYMRIRFFQPKPIDTSVIQTEHIIDLADWKYTNEYEIFQAAWIDLFGYRLNDEAMGKHFADYCYHNTIPTWVENYVRKTIEEDNPCKMEEKQ